jgi:IS1 family transposase/transposase-like protein
VNHTGNWPLVLVALGLVLGLMCWRRSLVAAPSSPPRPARRRAWCPRTPDDCAACRAAPAPGVAAGAVPGPVRPWADVKGRRGAPKRLATAGYACPSPACPYYGIVDERVHALVGYGHHGTSDRIQDFRCQACGTKVSARRGTALAHLKTPPARVGEVLGALAEGLDVAAAVRVFGHGEGTIARWQARAGQHADRLHNALFRRLHLPHVQLDEIRTRLRARRDGLWLWVALDPVTKIVPALHLGPRTQASAHALIHALAARLRPGCVPVVTSDGLRLYYYALTAHFGRWLADGRHRAWRVADTLVYGQIEKTYRHRRIVRVTSRMVVGTWTQLRSGLCALGLSGRLNTAFVERVNLTLRRGVAALARRTWATAQTAPGLAAQVAWWRGYYHFVRPHHALRVPLSAPQARGGRRHPRRYRARTPAMAAGITPRRWTVAAFLGTPTARAE